MVNLLVGGEVLQDRSLSGAGKHVLVERGGLAVPTLAGVNVRDVDIECSVVVNVTEGRTHAVAGIECSGFFGNVRERTVAVIVQERVAPEVVDHIHVGIAVAVIVSPGHAQRDACLMYPGFLCHVRKVKVAVVVKQRVAFAVARVEEGRRKILARVQIAADVQI